MTSFEPRFDGADYDAQRDWTRLTTQLGRVHECMSDGRWRSLDDIARATGDPQASISAQLRNLRKKRFGGHTVEKKHIKGGHFVYRVKREAHE
jgi:hypothetical protein